MVSLGERIRNVYNAFVNNDTESAQSDPTFYAASTSGGRPDRVRFYFSNERSIVTSIYTRISVDIASVQVKHIRLDDEDRYLEDVDSGLNNCLLLEANIDQAARAFKQDIAMTLCDKGVAAIVPVDTKGDPLLSD